MTRRERDAPNGTSGSSLNLWMNLSHLVWTGPEGGGAACQELGSSTTGSGVYCRGMARLGRRVASLGELVR